MLLCLRSCNEIKLLHFNPPVVLESRKERSEEGRMEGRKKEGRKGGREEGRMEGRKEEGTVKTDGVNLTREDDRVRVRLNLLTL